MPQVVTRKGAGRQSEAVAPSAVRSRRPPPDRCVDDETSQTAARKELAGLDIPRRSCVQGKGTLETFTRRRRGRSVRKRADCDVSYSLSLSSMQEWRSCVHACVLRHRDADQSGESLLDPFALRRVVLAFLHNTSFRSRQSTEGTSSSTDR